MQSHEESLGKKVSPETEFKYAFRIQSNSFWDAFEFPTVHKVLWECNLFSRLVYLFSIADSFRKVFIK